MSTDKAAGVVVLIPGLWMPAWVMLPLGRRLRARGHATRFFGYASMRGSLADNAARLAQYIHASGADPVHLVGHSLGGVLALHTAAQHGVGQVKRIVMIGSPYVDSHVARRLARFGWGHTILGHTVAQWLCGEKTSAPPGTEVGVIAGTLACGLGMIVAPDLRKPHDGVIRVAETPVPGMAACVETRASHAGLLLSSSVARLVHAFLTRGNFILTPARTKDIAAQPSGWSDREHS